MYRKVFAGSSTPFERLSTLYIGAIRQARQGRQAAIEGNADAAKQCAEKVDALLRRLDVCLDFQAAPELCANLSALYKHMGARLLQAEATTSPAIFEEVITILEKLWDGFQEAEKQGQS